MPKRIAAVAITEVAGSGLLGAGAHGVLELVGVKATHFTTVRVAIGWMFAAGVTATE